LLKSDRIIALNIGASKLVLAEFSIGKTGVPELINYGIGPLGADLEEETDLSSYIVSSLRDLLIEKDIKPAPLYMTVSGQAVFPRYVKLPPVTEDKLVQIINYEAEQNVPFPIEEVVWDYQLIGSAEGELNVMLVAVKTENVTSLTDCVQGLELEPEIVDVAPMALYNMVRYNYPSLDGCSMILDIGARSTNLIFLEQEKIFSRSIPVSGSTITKEIMKDFDLPFQEAEQLKLDHAFVSFGGVYAGADDEISDRVSKIVRNVVTRLHAEVNRSINFYKSQQGGEAPNLVLLTGGSSIVPHMDTFFQEKLGVDVEYLNPFVNIPLGPSLDPEQVASDMHLLGEVAGLSLRKALSCPVEINLMPPDIASKKVFRNRQPFFALTGLGLILIMLCWWVYFFRMKVMLENRSKVVNSRISNLQSIQSQLEKEKKKVDTAKVSADELAGLIFERSRWLHLITALHSSMREGMWITKINTIVEEKQIVGLIVSGSMFVDEYKDLMKELSETAENTEIKTPMDDLTARIKSNDCFEEAKINIQKEEAKIKCQVFELGLKLKEPINLK